ncbi:efflux RND transporter periplasmic adaptor subunit [Lutibacter sp. A64]|uniref:efflux RND transporter periplasmic adaptor subunit n=1 Tax=Lutibacter sp. A64 TaxID=2918526 RepID=UPI001F0667B3|nr:efflux RND transporter periplasmic adaptor subunit [Lutibacter sp. A64]UMB54690.1 efflux RND transporter periplasmic adaptor subunit [Lutibacter sp. A64]
MKIFNIYKLVLVLTLLISACSTSKKEEQIIESKEDTAQVTVTQAQFSNSKMELGSITLQPFSEGVVTNGFIDVPPSGKAKVSAIMEGFIKTLPLLIGDKVKKGQLVLTLQNPDFIEIQQNYLEIFEQLKYLKNEYVRQKTLFEEKITSQKNYLKAESDYKSSVAHFNSLEQKLRLMNINTENVKAGKFTSVISMYAPISGSISQLNSGVGMFMNASDVILEIVNTEHKHLELIVFEKDVLKVKEGQNILFKTPENSEKAYKAKVHLIGKSIDETKRTVKVHGHLEDESEQFLVGMFVEAEIITHLLKKNALPVTALLEEGEHYFILVLNSKDNDVYNFEKLPVKIGSKNEDWVEIIDSNDILDNRQILIKGAFIPLDEA